MAVALIAPLQFPVAGLLNSKARSPLILSCRARARICLQSGRIIILSKRSCGAMMARSVCLLIDAETIYLRSVDWSAAALFVFSARLSHAQARRRPHRDLQYVSDDAIISR